MDCAIFIPGPRLTLPADLRMGSCWKGVRLVVGGEVVGEVEVSSFKWRVVGTALVKITALNVPHRNLAADGGDSP